MDVPFLIRGVGVLLFAYAAVCDWRYRRAPNLVWGLITALGVSAIVLELQTTTSRAAVVAGVILSTILVSAVAISSWQHGWVGGADAKAAMVLPIIFPHLPGTTFEGRVFGVLTQGVEVVVWVWIGTAIAGLCFSKHEKYEEGIPFLVPFFAGILVLYFV